MLYCHSKTRESLCRYDCLGMGAIPVLFEPAALEIFPFQHAVNPAEFIAFVPRALATSDGFNVVDYLAVRFPVRQQEPLLAVKQ